MPESEALLVEIKNKIRSMREARTALEKEYGSVSVHMKDMKTELDSRDERITELEKELEMIKMAKSIGGEGKNLEARSKINEMVKEIDRCIAMLNS
jgi:chromosome segregation ATPase